MLCIHVQLNKIAYCFGGGKNFSALLSSPKIYLSGNLKCNMLMLHASWATRASFNVRDLAETEELRTPLTSAKLL